MGIIKSEEYVVSDVNLSGAVPLDEKSYAQAQLGQKGPG